jgi:hypothetical protein
MPRCQRNFRYLGAGAVTPGAGVSSWNCPYCDDHESYTTVRDVDLIGYASLAEQACVADFGPASDQRLPHLLIRGIRPECVYEPVDRRYDIYLAAESDPWQARLQIGHELFHRVAGEGRVFHWTHEMLACLVSVRLLERSGLAEYASVIRAQYATEAERCSYARMAGADPWADAVYPPGYYGRAFETGEQLKRAIGWPALCRLARSRRNGPPDLTAWLETLPENNQSAVQRLLSGTMPHDTK